MGEIPRKSEIPEAKTPEANGFREIKPEGSMTMPKAREFFDKLFAEKIQPKSHEQEKPEADLEKTTNDYIKKLKDVSEFPDTIPDHPFEASDLKKISPEENEAMRKEFDDKKDQLKREWEDANGESWPKYTEDVYSDSGKLIREKGQDYDVHHIQPLGLDGKNEVGNITPIHANDHYDRQGVHAPDSLYSKLAEQVGGN